ncbi:MAG: hypothetical protein ACYTEG_13595, partial [Planctomycetota bacterium]
MDGGAYDAHVANYPALVVALVFVSSACPFAFAQRTVADEIAALKDPKQRGIHARAALALGYAENAGPAARAALIDACRSRDPVLAACAAHALGQVGSPSLASFNALLGLLDYPVTLREPAKGAKGWGLLSDRAFVYRYVPRGRGGYTDWVVFRTWGKRQIQQSIHAAPRLAGPKLPGGAPVEPHGGWTTSTNEVRLTQQTPATVQLVGANPAAGWRLEGDGLVAVSGSRPTRWHASKPGALRGLVRQAATEALRSVLARGDAALVRRALEHE